MPQPKIIDNPEYRDIFIQILQSNSIPTSKLLQMLHFQKSNEIPKGRHKVEVIHRNLLRKLKKMERLNLIAFEEIKRKNGENVYFIDFNRLSKFYWELLCQTVPYMKETPRTQEQFFKTDSELIKDYLKTYLTNPDFQQQPTIRRLFFFLTANNHRIYSIYGILKDKIFDGMTKEVKEMKIQEFEKLKKLPSYLSYSFGTSITTEMLKKCGMKESDPTFND